MMVPGRVAQSVTCLATDACLTEDPSGKSQGNLVFLQGHGKVREFCKIVREIRKSSKVREKSGNFKIMFG